MSRKVFIIILALFCFTAPIFVFADEAAEIQKIKGVLTSEEEAEWAGDVEKIKSFFAPDFVMFGPSSNVLYDSDNNEIIDPVNYEISGSGADDVREYAERYREYPDYLKKNPEFRHSIVVEKVSVKGNLAIAVEKRVRSWPIEANREIVRHNMRNIWTLKKINGTWKLTSCLIHFSAGQLVLKMRPPK